LLAIAFLFNKSLNWFIWHDKLAWDGKLSVPRLLWKIASVLIYLTAGMIILWFVFDQPITAVVAISGVVALVLGYSAQSILKEIFSGISLQSR
jgi:small-conductance mechanosensitive channel